MGLSLAERATPLSQGLQKARVCPVYRTGCLTSNYSEMALLQREGPISMQVYLLCPQPTESEREHMLDGLGANRFLMFLMKQEQTLASRTCPRRRDLWAWRDHLRDALRVTVGTFATIVSRKVPRLPCFPFYFISVAL